MDFLKWFNKKKVGNKILFVCLILKKNKREPHRKPYTCIRRRKFSHFQWMTHFVFVFYTFGKRKIKREVFAVVKVKLSNNNSSIREREIKYAPGNCLFIISV